MRTTTSTSGGLITFDAKGTPFRSPANQALSPNQRGVQMCKAAKHVISCDRAKEPGFHPDGELIVNRVQDSETIAGSF
jgi:hypothetical protein